MVRRLYKSIVPHILSLLRKLRTFWRDNIAEPGRYAFKKLGMLFFFLLLAFAAGIGAYILQQVAFPEAGSSAEQISATVYVKTLPAHVNLQSTFTPGAAQNNFSLTVRVTGPTKSPDPWLLVVQCAAPSARPYPESVPFWSESLTSRQPVGRVLVRSGPTKKPLNFTCFTGLAEQGQTAATIVENRDLNLSLPVLEQNPDAASALADAPLYAEKIDGKYQNIVELQAVPGAPCPISTPGPGAASPFPSSAGPPAGTTSPSPTPTVSPSSTAALSPSPTATPSLSPSAAPATPGPNAVACYTQISQAAKPMGYSFPAPTGATTVVTSETLNNVNLSNERIDSMYPPGMITTDQVTWHGGVGLSPSVSATNLASAESQNKDAFWAGLLYGIAAALAIPYVVEFYKSWQERREYIVKNKSEEEHA